MEAMTATLKLRVYSARHPHGTWSWGYEIYNPAWPVERQVIIGAAWFDTWQRALNTGLAALPHPSTL